MDILEILKQYANPSSAPGQDVNAHFDTVAQQAATQDLSSGIAAALRSDATPSFGQTMATLFSRSNSEQQAGLLNHLMQALGPSAMAAVGGGVLGRLLGSTGTPGQITATQAAQVSPAEVNALATHAEQQDGSIVDRVSGFYAQHPALVKTLGVVALGVLMSHMSNRH